MWAPEEDYKQPLLNGNNSRVPTNGSGKYSGRHQPEHSSRKCNDILFAILFLGVIGGMIAISAIAYSKGDPSKLVPRTPFDSSNSSSETETEKYVISHLESLVAELRRDQDILIYSALLAIALGALWIQLLKSFTRFFIYFTLCIGVALVAALGIMFISLGRKESSESTQIVGYCLCACTLLLVILIVYLRKSIDLTCAMFTETCRGIQRSPSVFIVGALIVVFFLGFIAYWTSSFIYLFSIPGSTVNPFNDHSSHSGSTTSSEDLQSRFNTKIRNLMYFMIFAFLWASSFISAVFQHCVAGVVSNWYFSRDPTGKSAVGQENAFNSLGRAFTTSIGSLAFGSLIIGFIEFMQFMLQVCKNSNATNKLVVMVVSCLQCILGCIESIVRWINKFGYIYVAMHGHSFCTSTRECFDLISRNMFNAVIMDFIGGLVLLLGKIFGAAASALFTTGILYGMGKQLNPITIALSAIFAFCIFNLFTHIVGIGTDTIFVCYLEDLETNKDGNLYISPDLHELLQSKCEELNEKNKSSNV
ncbi:hypothetical protein DICPUDRAFT_148495 [Dictyostelium purpureum]|uniref:Choline transporter-like protein n=1 Tax=Dictyostelium purpureum TaxID=5786 RepID=F0ZB98_DICPU|nr:uncharacterized protein DICPUDRAFT_148495 [Dictyostelium purpureum]EGC38805.1 hypothetical protein DICPUDRAFT_148495 [Dictyostelium purpureum]|eukprot:XP_003284699.1 hypothetical protein DICPUDRAFT_148495 [Dictyostelium purpureum]